MRSTRDLLYLGGYALEPRVVRRYYGGGDPPPQSSHTTSQVTYSPEEQAMRNQVMSEGQSIYNTSKDKWASMINPGSKPVGASANTLQGQQMVKDTAMGAGQAVANQAAGALNFGLSGAALNPNSVPGFNGALDASLRRVDQAYQDPGGVLSQIRSGFTGANSVGSGTREGIASGIAGREYLNTVGDVSSKMALDQYGKGLDFMKSSMAFAPNMYNLMTQPGLTVGAVGAQQEAYAQQQEDSLAADRAWQLQGPWAGLSPWASMVTGMSNPITSTTGTSTGGGGGKSPITSALGGASMGYSMGGPWGAAAGGVLGLLGGL